MKKITTTVFLCVMLAIATAQPVFQWARGMNATTTSEAKAMTVDGAGNVLTTGVMKGSVDFDPGPGVFNLVAEGEGDIFISKLDAAGNFLWAKRIGGPTTDQGEAIAADASGNVYVSGWFSTGTEVDFDPGPGVFNLFDIGIEAFVLKLDGNGDFVWAKSIECPATNNSEYGKGIAIDAAGALFITGAFYNSIDLDPGPGTYILNAQGTTATDIFITKWDAVSGNFIWGKQLGGTSSDYTNRFCIDAVGNLLLSGYFSGTADFDPGPGTFNLISAGGTDIFVAKLTNDGDFAWARRWGGASNDDGYGICADINGNVLLATPFVGIFDADPGPGTLNVTSAGQFDVFVCKLNASGDFLWARRWGAALQDDVFDIKTDAAGNVYTGGSFMGNVDFDPGPGTYLLNAPGTNPDVFYSKLSPDGNLVWARKLDGGAGTIYALYVNAANEIFSSGYYSQTIDFDPGPGVYNLTALSTDIFIHKLGQAAVLPLTLAGFEGTATAGGDLLTWYTTQEINTKYFETEWSANGLVFTSMGIVPAAGYSAALRNYSYLHSNPAPGSNYYRLKMMDADGRFTYSSVIKISHSQDAFAIKVFPNPSAGIIHAEIQSQKNERMIYSVLNTEGRLVRSGYFDLARGSNSVVLDIRSLAPGCYFIVPGNDLLKAVKINKL